MVAGVIVMLAVPKYRPAVRQAVPRYRAVPGSQTPSAATAASGIRAPRHHGRADPGQQHRRPAGGVHARARRHGVAEAAYTAGLVALGIPNAAALSTAIAFRIVTYYLPPIWGAVAMRWLRQHAYL